MNAATLTAQKPKLTAHDHAIRRDRIFARMLEGQSYQEIAAAEAITPRRVRQIIQAALQKDNVDPQTDFILVQIARLEAALRVIEQKVAEGKLSAVDRLVKVLEKLDRYHAQCEPPLSLARRDRWESAGMLAGVDRIAATREAVAGRLAAGRLGAENSIGKVDGGQTPEIARFAETSALPGALESKA
ncbi:hypothetical protein [Methylocapsa sp. S129]|uniref:hypothetical protein n=1 Tax=Methylocapsa sp. S129 TaxID=1641869 RepID=UPI00131AE2CC|nr:hypothetical protein [Methylocapsa sp. S129]